MPRGMDERFNDPSEEVEEEKAMTEDETGESLSESEREDRKPESDRKSTRLNSSHITRSRMPSSA